jgi:hypothetical protein
VLVTDVYSSMAAQVLPAAPRPVDGVVHPANAAQPAGPNLAPAVVAVPPEGLAAREVVLVYPDGTFSISELDKLKAHAIALLGEALVTTIGTNFWHIAGPNATRITNVERRKLNCSDQIEQHGYIRSFIPSLHQSVVSDRSADTPRGKELKEMENELKIEFARQRSRLQIAALELDLESAGQCFKFGYLWTEALRASDRDLVGFGKLADTKKILEATVDNVFKEGDARRDRFESHSLPAMRSIASILQHEYDDYIVSLYHKQRKAAEKKRKEAEKRDAADKEAQQDKNASVAAIAEQAAAGAAQEASRPLESRIARLENALTEVHNSNLTLVAAVKKLLAAPPHHSIVSPQRGTPNRSNGTAPAPPSQSRPPPSPAALKPHAPQSPVRSLDFGNAKPNASAKPRAQPADKPAAYKAPAKRSAAAQQGEPPAKQLPVTPEPATRGQQRRTHWRQDPQQRVTNTAAPSNPHSTRSATSRGRNQNSRSQSPRSGNAFASLAEPAPPETDLDFEPDEGHLDGTDPDTTNDPPRVHRRRGRGGWRGGSGRGGSHL